MKTVNTIMGPFDLKRYHGLRKAYVLAKEHELAQFQFEKGDWHTEFAKYMLEFLSNTFDDKKKA